MGSHTQPLWEATNSQRDQTAQWDETPPARSRMGKSSIETFPSVVHDGEDWDGPQDPTVRTPQAPSSQKDQPKHQFNPTQQ